MTFRSRLVFEFSLLAATVWAVASLAWRDLRRAVVQLAAYPPAVVAGYRRARRMLLKSRECPAELPPVSSPDEMRDYAKRLEAALARAQLRRARAEGRLN